MSAALVCQTGQQHELKDDLESSIYVLLWVALMYSKTSDSMQAFLFITHVLNHNQPFGTVGFYHKSHFLVARTFLAHTKFIHRPALDKLVEDLACLLGTRYMKAPSDKEREEAEAMRVRTIKDPTLLDFYHKMGPCVFDDRMSKLENHHATINLFETALSDPDWPENDLPIIQDFNEVKLQVIRKSGWRTSSIVSRQREPKEKDEVGELVTQLTSGIAF